MFTLRKITGENVQMNISLGKSYDYIGKQESPEAFERTLDFVCKRLNEEIIYAFVSDENGRETYPLYKTHKNYILTENGKTFADVNL